MINKIKKIIKKPKILLYYLDRMNVYRMNDSDYIRILFEEMLEKKVELDFPKKFNEKLQWLKLYDRNPEYTKMVDKYEVKKYISDKLGEEYLIENYGVWNKFDEIDFDILPKQFVLKCTHDSGGLVICKDKNNFDFVKARKKIEKSLKNNYFYSGREWPYKNVEPRIIAEKYMIDDSGNDLKDFKFLCFNGMVKIVLVCSNRFVELEETFFDEEWNLLDLKRPNKKINKDLKKPINFDKMKELAEQLSKDIPFIRVDFYECNGKIYFGELTFYPASGFAKFEPEEWDLKLGEMLELSKEMRVE